MDGFFSLAIPGGALSAALLGVGLALLVLVGAWQARREPHRRRRALLIALRTVTALAAWVVAVQPRWFEQQYDETPGRLAVVVDASRSMALPRGDDSRLQRTRALLDRWAEENAEPVAAFSFGDDLAASRLEDLAEGLTAEADQSQLGEALASLLDSDSASTLGALVVVSDGAVEGEDELAALARHGVRIHTVAVGEEGFRDDAIVQAVADPVGFLRRPARVRVTVRGQGGAGGPIPVTLRRGDEVVREVVAEVPAGGEVVVEVPFTPTRIGREVYRVSIPRAPTDAVPENNERAFLVRVTRDKLRVLLVAGQPSWDERFLRRFLKRDPATDLISFFILRNTADMTMAGADELALIPFPTDELFNEHLGSFDLVIFQNFEFGPYQMASYLPRIRDYVVRGGSFAMIGGPLSFHSGGYSATPIAEVLPVELPPLGASPTTTVVTDRFSPRLAASMRRHPLLSLSADAVQNDAVWEGLAPLVGANVVTRARRSATVLLEHPSRRTEAGLPLPILVVGSAGRGRTLALTTDTTWRWGITTGGLTGDASAYERFWDRAVRWLVRDPSLEPARITTTRERYGPGARAHITGQLRTARYEPYENVGVALRLSSVDGRAHGNSQARTDREGSLDARMELPRRPGAYRLEARLAGQEELLASEWLIVEAGGDELADPRPQPERLRRWSEATGGSFFDSVDAAPDLSAVDTTRRRSLGVTEHAPTSEPWAFGLVVALFVLEWVLRRRWGSR